MLAKNQKAELYIDDMTAEGSGVGRFEGVAVFVPGALPGERVRARIIKTAPSYAVGKLEALLENSPDRISPPCPVFARCGGCTHLSLSYDAQLKLKERTVAEALRRIGGVTPEIRPIIGAKEPLRYRNKAQFPVGPDGAAGLFAARSHDLVPVDDCLIQHPVCARIIGAVHGWMKENGIPGYDEHKHSGIVRNIVIRTNSFGQAMVLIVTLGRAFPAGERLLSRLRRIPEVVSLIKNINPKRTNVVTGEECVTLWGADTLKERLCGLIFSISPLSFFQVNPAQAEKLYRLAGEFAALSGSETVCDLYCGTGTIGLTMAGRAKRVVGVEVNPSAIKNAIENAKNNGIENAEFIEGEAETVLPRLISEGVRPDVLLLDPPRKGCAQPLLKAAANAAPARIVYISCNPATLARDVKILCECGYAAKTAQPVDMFPQTGHVETCVLLSHKNPQTSPPSL